MKSILVSIVAVMLLVGCGESQQSVPPAEAKPVAEAAQPEPPTTKAPDIPLWEAAMRGNIEAVKQHLAAGADVNVKDARGMTPLHLATSNGQKEIVEPLIAAGADVNAKMNNGMTPLDVTSVIPPNSNKTEIIDLLRKHGGTSDWLKGARFDQSRILAAPRSQSREEANRRPPPQTRRQDG